MINKDLYIAKKIDGDEEYYFEIEPEKFDDVNCTELRLISDNKVSKKWFYSNGALLYSIDLKTPKKPVLKNFKVEIKLTGTTEYMVQAEDVNSAIAEALSRIKDDIHINERINGIVKNVVEYKGK